MEAVIFIGLQGAGKSSFYRARFFDSHVRLNLDMLHTRHRETLLLRACIEARQPFVADNTNPSVAERARYLTAAEAVGYRLVGYYFRMTLAESLRRNAARTGGKCIPEKGIFGTYKRLQVPTYDEGFHALYAVTTGEDAVAPGFMIEPL